VRTFLSDAVLDVLADVVSAVLNDGPETADAPGLASDPTKRADNLDPILQSGDIASPEEAQ
jgi:hypothetical protein